MADLEALSHWLEPLIRQLEPSQQRALARDIARELRRSQSKRITAQRNPDGSVFEPRKRQPEPKPDKKGRIRARAGQIRRGAMFRRIRTARFLRTSNSAAEAVVGFSGRVARIAAVHQHGLRDAVRPGGPEVDYPARELLGFSDADRDLIESLVLKHLGGAE